MRRAPSFLCGALLLVIHPALGLSAAPVKPPLGRQVELVVARPAEEMPRFQGVLREVLARKGLGLSLVRKDTITPEDVARATTASPEEAALIVARVFVDFVTPGHVTLFLMDPRRNRIHVRSVMLDHGFDAVARESALFVIEQSIDAILEGREIGVSREEYQRSVAGPAPVPASPPTAEPPPPPPPPPAARDRTRWLVAGGYQGIAVGSAAYQHAGKLLVAARLPRVQIAVAARAAVPRSIGNDGVRARLWTAGLGLAGTARIASFGSLAVSAGLDGGLDLTRVAPTASAADLQAAAVFWAGGPWLRPFVQVEQLFGRISLAIAVGLEAHLLAERYTVRTDSETRDIFVPRRLRPEAALLAGVIF